MITAVDTSVLLDVFGADPTYGSRSRDALRSCITEGRLTACEVVWAEVIGFFPSLAAGEQALRRLGVDFDALERETALEAGRAWKLHRARGGSRLRVAADFLIGAHALCQADRLLTRDRGFYRAYFRRLSIIDPSRT